MANNFLQWNPNANNQESDAAYSADSQRSGGAATNATFSSALANKLWYQLTTFLKAFGNMMDVKGYAPVDGSSSPGTAVANLQAVLANVITAADFSVYNFVRRLYRNAVEVDISASGDQQVFTYTVAGNTVGASGKLRIHLFCAFTSGVSTTWTFKVSFGGQVFSWTEAMSSSTNGIARIDIEITNRNSTSSQGVEMTMALPSGFVSVGTCTLVHGRLGSGSVNTAVNQVLDFTVNMGTNLSSSSWYDSSVYLE